LVDRQLLDRGGLEVVHDLARVLITQLVEQRPLGGRVGDRLRGRIKNDKLIRFGQSADRFL